MILSVCDVPDVLKIMKLIKLVILIIKIAVPIILIISIIIDLVKQVMEPDEFSKVGGLIVKKIIAAVLVFLIPTFVSIIFDILSPNNEYKRCFDMASNTVIEEKYEAYMEDLMEELRRNPNSDNYYAAERYLSNITDPDLKEKYTKELSIYKPKIKVQEIAIADSSFLLTAKNVWDKIVSGPTNYVYHNGNTVPPKNGYCDCSTYVSWVLYEYGYDDFKGSQHSTAYFYGTDLNKKYGWEEIKFGSGTNITSMVKPGDIVVRRGVKDGSTRGHTDIIIKTEGSNVYAYDCANSKYVKNGANPNGVKVNWFMTDNRPGKIIRVNKPIS